MQTLLLERMRNILTMRATEWVEKKMMGGNTFMVDDKMCFGTFRDGVLFRIDPKERASLLEQTSAETIEQGGREMKGYVYVLPEGLYTDEQLEFWIDRCLEFNPKAKSSKKKNKPK